MIVKMEPTSHSFTEQKVALVSGLSDPKTCALSGQQMAFLQSLKLPSEQKIALNFPYVRQASRVDLPPPSVLLASWRNYRQFKHASSAEYVEAAKQHFSALLESTNRLLLVTLSCGLEIVRCALPWNSNTTSVTVVALGPVARHLPVDSCYTVQGTRDIISKLFLQVPDHAIPKLGHMGYMQSGEVQDIVNEYL